MPKITHNDTCESCESDSAGMQIDGRCLLCNAYDHSGTIEDYIAALEINKVALMKEIADLKTKKPNIVKESSVRIILPL